MCGEFAEVRQRHYDVESLILFQEMSVRKVFQLNKEVGLFYRI